MNITTKEYLKIVEQECINQLLDKGYEEFDLEVIQVWYCKTIQNHKGLFIIRDLEGNVLLPYFIEATYNGDRSELYLDYYTKQFKSIVKCYDKKVNNK